MSVAEQLRARLDRRHLLLIALAAFSVLSLVLRENYPFSHFPMYGNPGNDVYYHWLADEQQQPLPVAQLTGKTAAQLGKMIRSHKEAAAKKLKVSAKKLPQSELDVLYRETLAYLRQQSANVKQSLPAKLKLVRTDVTYTDGQLTETPHVVYAE
jgi:hypothetical protein